MHGDPLSVESKCLCVTLCVCVCVCLYVCHVCVLCDTVGKVCVAVCLSVNLFASASVSGCFIHVTETPSTEFTSILPPTTERERRVRVSESECCP